MVCLVRLLKSRLCENDARAGNGRVAGSTNTTKGALLFELRMEWFTKAM